MRLIQLEDDDYFTILEALKTEIERCKRESLHQAVTDLRHAYAAMLRWRLVLHSR